MKAIVVGCGRVGSKVAKKLAKSGWEVDRNRRGRERWAWLRRGLAGGFIVGHGMDVKVLRDAGIEEADAVVVATNGDNTNIVVGQVAQKRFGIDCTVVRILDPARARALFDARPARRLPDLERDRRPHRGGQVVLHPPAARVTAS